MIFQNNQKSNEGSQQYLSTSGEKLEARNIYEIPLNKEIMDLFKSFINNGSSRNNLKFRIKLSNEGRPPTRTEIVKCLEPLYNESKKAKLSFTTGFDDSSDNSVYITLADIDDCTSLTLVEYNSAKASLESKLSECKFNYGEKKKSFILEKLDIHSNMDITALSMLVPNNLLLSLDRIISILFPEKYFTIHSLQRASDRKIEELATTAIFNVQIMVRKKDNGAKIPNSYPFSIDTEYQKQINLDRQPSLAQLQVFPIAKLTFCDCCGSTEFSVNVTNSEACSSRKRKLFGFRFFNR